MYDYVYHNRRRPHRTGNHAVWPPHAVLKAAISSDMPFIAINCAGTTLTWFNASTQEINDIKKAKNAGKSQTAHAPVRPLLMTAVMVVKSSEHDIKASQFILVSM